MTSHSVSRVLEKEGQSIAIAEDLIINTHEWVNIQEIIRLSFRSVLEALKFQSTAISELERGLAAKPNKSDLQSMLTTRSIDNAEHLARVKDEILGLSSAFESKLRDKLSRGEAELIVSRGYNEEFRLTDSKIRDIQVEHEKLKRNVDNLAEDIAKSLTRLDTMTVVDDLISEVKLKATSREVEDSLRFMEERLQTAINRKTSKADVDAALARKADQAVLQRVMGALESKAEITSLDQINAALCDKADRSEVGHILTELAERLHRREAEDLRDRLKDMQVMIERSRHELAVEADNRHRLIRDEISHTQSTITNFAEELNSKAEVLELDKVFALIKRKADAEETKDQIQRLRTELHDSCRGLAADIENDRITSDNSAEDIKRSVEGVLRRLAEDLAKAQDSIQELDKVRRRDFEDTNKLVKSQSASIRADFISSVQELSSEIKQLHEYVSQVEQARPDYTYLDDFRQTLDKNLLLKADIHEVQLALSSAQRDVAKTVSELKDEARVARSQLESDISKALDGKLSSAELSDRLSDKIDKKDLLKHLNSRASVDDLEFIRSEFTKTVADTKNFISRTEFKDFSVITGRALEDLGKELLLKANIKDLFILLDSKANVDDINETLKEIHAELDTKANLSELNEHVSEQNSLNQLFCSENCTGRWIWRSGNTRSGLVPWEAEAINACPENFIWERESTSIVTIAPGLYEVSWGFFGKKKPNVELIVNSDPVLNTATRKAVPSSSKVSGQTSIDYLTLPAKARIAVSVNCPTPCEGFLSLRKL
mmetsp:Transcript_19086/g.34712  ORF Transcript_19086/g.34712 Transcript_19086/m.34712 type:complete len:776 (-) Transcript_19086:1549-3876(-)